MALGILTAVAVEFTPQNRSHYINDLQLLTAEYGNPHYPQYHSCHVAVNQRQA